MDLESVGEGADLAGIWEEQREHAGYFLEKLNQLSAPRGVRYKCEHTGANATVCLVNPYVKLYYSSEEVAILCWEGIMHKIVHILAPLRSKPTKVGSEEARQKRERSVRMTKRALIDLTGSVAQTFLNSGDHRMAIPGAIQSLNLAKDVFGANAIEVVPSYLLLAEANLGSRDLKQANEYLSLASWIVMKKEECSYSIKAKLQCNYGKLYAAQGKYAEAAKYLAESVYLMSMHAGPEHVNTATMYFHLATVFDAQNRVESALAMYDKVVDIWHNYLNALRTAKDSTTELDILQISEATQMLQQIIRTRQQFLGEDHIASGEARFTLGLLHILEGEGKLESALSLLENAHDIYLKHLGPGHPSTKNVEEVHSLIQQQVA